MALLDALNGAASDTSADGWPIRPGNLVDKFDRILALHRLPEEKTQTPAGRMAGSFEITFPGEAAAVPTYIALADPAAWSSCRIEVKVNGEAAEPIDGQPGESPFKMRRLPELALVEVEARSGGVGIGSSRQKVRPPATFVSIGKDAAAFAITAGALPASRGPIASCSKLVVGVRGPVNLRFGAMLVIAGRGFGNSPRREEILDIGGGENGFELPPGDYEATLRFAEGAHQSGTFSLAEGEVKKIEFEAPPSPQEWMNLSIGTASMRRSGKGAAPFSVGKVKVSAEIVGPIDLQLAGLDGYESRIELARIERDARFVTFAVIDAALARYELVGTLRAENPTPPLFARLVRGDGREELAVLPSFGGGAGRGWRVFLLVDPEAAHSDRMTSVVVKDPRWAGLLGFLGARDMEAGTQLLGFVSDNAIAALHDKISNPLAAVTGALIAVGASRPDVDKFWDP